MTGRVPSDGSVIDRDEEGDRLALGRLAAMHDRGALTSEPFQHLMFVSGRGIGIGPGRHQGAEQALGVRGPLMAVAVVVGAGGVATAKQLDLDGEQPLRTLARLGTG